MKNKLWGVLLLGTLFFTSCDEKRGHSEAVTISKDNTEYVNPFIGTGGHGHTFPGATVPNAMVQLSPDTRTAGWDACGGYHYTDRSLKGFSHTHLSGTGIGDLGDFLFMPFTGKTKLEAGSPENPDEGFRSRFSHDDELAEPGYYSVKLLDYRIKAELTASTRVGFHKYTFPDHADKKLIIDTDHTVHDRNVVNSTITVLSDTEISGYKHIKGWAPNRHIYFYAKFNQAFDAELFKDKIAQESLNEVTGRKLLAVLNFKGDKSEPLLIKVGISSVDAQGAKNNLEKEVRDWDFDRVKQEAHTLWKKHLDQIEVEGGSEDEKTIFYTSLYHTGMSPYVFSDVDGRYRGMDQKIYTSDKNIYTVFSLWDTFRAFHPLLNITQPEKNNAFINTLLTKYDHGGVLPKWELNGNYTGCMIGYHSIPVIVDAYFKGIRDFDIEKAYKAMIHASTYNDTGILFPSEDVKEKVSPMAKKYNEELGYIPSDLENESVSKALEYAYNDWCIAQMAKDLGKTEDYERYLERSKRYLKYFDKETGFMRGLQSNGEFREPFDPKYSQHRKDDYVEGNAWQWTWFVPHDVNGLVELMGGKEKFIGKLDELFTTSSEIKGEHVSSDISGLIGQYAHGNEPSHHITHMYNFVGQPWKTQKLTDDIMSTLYFNHPNGLSGNEDCGQMSAWYILNAMGFYSFSPGNDTYSIGRPIFDKVTINLTNGKKFTVVAKNNDPKHLYVQSLKLNGVDLEAPFFTHKDIVEGSTIEFEMGPLENKTLFN
ncbi:GH92 family glycosyl hydrolase [Tamlana fucoidanivorans]|uniref:Glycoside hydrolase family 92 protein n=1 Tax=Allotamlana fucoidanivorans TaxID=2583814 RepID=A0A5C4SLP2_9FLAO|nr:GH92 family glycosyl hydrolase [Tamlana fucoidanivorans]TNJ44913.1 glycoside hydrolase family 92 protein [Tamlana fucoidanivorans]